jgi:hypothetical protein
MSEIKHIFTGGKMNKDLDERLVQNGEYRDAMNIQVRTTDDNDSGTMQNIKGNIETGGINVINTDYTEYSFDENAKPRCIASVSDEKNDDIYFFIASPEKGDLTTGGQSLQVTNQQMFQGINQAGRVVLADTIVKVSTNTTGLSTKSLICADTYCVYSSPDDAFGDLLDDGTYDWESDTNVDFLPNDDNWISFRVTTTLAAKLRPGMEVFALTATGTNLFDNAIIQEVTVNTGEITLYNQQDYDNSDDNIAYFRFEAPRVLNFNKESNITGINIIDNLLIWTDGLSEPKKINIDRSRGGTLQQGETHTDLFLQNDNGVLQSVNDIYNAMSPTVFDPAIAEEHVTVMRKAPVSPPSLHMSITDRIGLTEYDLNEFAFTIGGIVVEFGDDITIEGTDIDFSDTDFRPDDILTFTQVDPDVDDLIVLKAKFVEYLDSSGDSTLVPDESIRVKMITVDTDLLVSELNWLVELEMKKPLFETKFGRFGYRYLYEDGEYSAFSPWSEIAFLPGPFDYLPKKGYNLGMENQVRELVVRDFIPLNSDRPLDVKGVDVLFKATDSANVYIVRSIVRGRDAEWESFTPNEEMEELAGTGELTITSENIHSALPESQLLRSWDNVPRYALGQEITANRLCFANYTQGYDILDQVNLITSVQSTDTPTVDSPDKSIKSIRDYKLGMVFLDKYGRETPVIESGFSTSELISSADEGTVLTGDITVEKRLARFKNQFRVQHNWGLTATGQPPAWAEYVKYYIKETSSEYYNLVMDKWYNAEDGNVWLSFNSADRNKVDEETYLILKNQNGSDVPVEEKARYKILAIENEAPEYIKIDRRYMGSVRLDTGTETDPPGVDWTSAGVINTSTQVPDILMNATSVEIPTGDWDGLVHHTLMGESRGTLKLRFTGRTHDTFGGIVNIVPTSWVTVSNLSSGQDPTTSPDTTIFWNDAFENELNMLERFGALGLPVIDTSSYGRLEYWMEFMEEVVENKPEFDGKFFAKIETDITIEENIMLLTPATTEWKVIDTYSIGFISTQTWNPAKQGPYSPENPYSSYADAEADDFAGGAWGSTQCRRYKTAWGGNTKFDPSGTLDCQPATSNNWVNNNAAYSINKFKVGTNNWTSGDAFIDGVDQNWRGGWIAPVSGGPNDHTWPNNIGWWNAGHMAPHHIQNFAMGCAEYDAGEAWYTWGGYFTAEFWHRRTDTAGLGNQVFIDNARAAWFNWSNDEDVAEEIFDEVNATDSWTWHPLIQWGFNFDIDGSDQDYRAGSGFSYRPQGLHAGPGCPAGTLNRIVFSQTDDDETNWVANAAGNAAERFKNMMIVGQKFRFAADPNSRIYQVTETIENDTAGVYGPSKNYWRESDSDSGWVTNSMADQDDYPVFNWADDSPLNDNWDDDPFYLQVGGPTSDCNGVSTTCSDPNILYEFIPTYTMTGEASWSDDAAYDDEEVVYRIDCGTCGPDDDVGGGLACWRNSIRVTFALVDPATGSTYPSTSSLYNYGIDVEEFDPRGHMRHDGSTSTEIEVVSKVGIAGGVVDIPENAACWETEPKESVDVDLYYEASGALPLKLKEGNTTSFIPIGSKVGSIKTYNGSEQITDITNNDTEDHKVTRIYYGHNYPIVEIKSTDDGIDYDLHTYRITIGNLLTFTHSDGTITRSKIANFYNIIDTDSSSAPYRYQLQKQKWYTVSLVKNADDEITISNEDDVWSSSSEMGGVGNDSNTSVTGNGVPPGTYINNYSGSTSNVWMNNSDWMDVGVTYTVYLVKGTGWVQLSSDVWDQPTLLGWHNCYSFGNGVESDRVRDDFNAPQIDNGVKVSSTFSGYKSEIKSSGIIHSGVYNSTSETNELNEFNMSGKITKDLNPAYGSIQALKTRDNNIVCLTEDRVIKVLAGKDALYNSDGNSQLVSTNRVLGDATPFSGDYGISKNPESLAWDNYRLYFTDKQRGAVLRLSMDGLTPISNVGMKAWFREYLQKSQNVNLLGTFDTVNGEYNLTFNYPLESQEDTTISYNEASKGWISFKSFIPEAGGSVSGKYLTALGHRIYDHNVGEVDGEPNQNTFYGEYTDSSFSVLFNDNNSIIKSFYTINYEGSQARVVQNLDDTNEFYNIENKDGWWVESLVTDSQNGNVQEFIEKEGKWFNKINGVFSEGGEYISQNTEDFSIQGIGFPIPPPPEPIQILAPTFLLTPQYASIPEGGSSQVLLMTTNLPNGTFVGFQITGTVNNSDIQIQGGCADESNDLNYFWDQSIPVEGAGVIEGGIGGIYSNGFTVGSLASNMAVLNQGDITACEDQVTEGPETLIITLIGYQIPGGEYMYINEAIQATITINDTSVEVEEISDKLLTVKNDEQEDTPNN